MAPSRDLPIPQVPVPGHREALRLPSWYPHPCLIPSPGEWEQPPTCSQQTEYQRFWEHTRLGICDHMIASDEVPEPTSLGVCPLLVVRKQAAMLGTHVTRSEWPLRTEGALWLTATESQRFQTYRSRSGDDPQPPTCGASG